MDLLANQFQAHSLYKFNVMKLVSMPRDTAVHTHYSKRLIGKLYAAIWKKNSDGQSVDD